MLQLTRKIKKNNKLKSKEKRKERKSSRGRKKFTFAPMPPLVEKIGQLDLNQFEHEVNLIMNATCKTTKIEGNFAYGKLPHSSPARAHCNEVYQEPRKNGKQAQQALETFFNVVKTTYNCDC